MERMSMCSINTNRHSFKIFQELFRNYAVNKWTSLSILAVRWTSYELSKHQNWITRDIIRFLTYKLLPYSATHLFHSTTIILLGLGNINYSLSTSSLKVSDLSLEKPLFFLYGILDKSNYAFDFNEGFEFYS